MDPIPTQALIEAALQTRQNAHAPHSRFLVGAALLSIDNKIYTGCNIEFASYTITCCAERTALLKALSEGVHDFTAIAVVGGLDGDPLPLRDYVYPCGVCRQALFEQNADLAVVIARDSIDYILYTISELLPHGFGRNGMF